jgi:hypothetical protein
MWNEECKSCKGNGHTYPEASDLYDFEIAQAEIESGLWNCKECGGTGEVRPQFKWGEWYEDKDLYGNDL